MNYVIKNKNKYLKYDSNNKITWTTTLSLAHEFTYDKANAIIKNSISSKERKNYKIEALDQDSIVDVCKSNSFDETIFEDGKFNWIGMCVDISQFINQLPQYKYNLEQKYKKVELEKTDLEHYIEFFDLNAAQGYMAYKMLQDIRKKRRNIKDEMIIVDILLDSNLDDFTSGRVIKRIHGLEERKYSPRVLTELFEMTNC